MWGRDGSKKTLDGKKRKKVGRTKRRPFQFEALEPRLLLSADVPLPIEALRDAPGILPAVVEKAAAPTEEIIRAGDDVNPSVRPDPGNGAGTEGVRADEAVSPAGDPADVAPGIQEPSSAAAVENASSDGGTADAASSGAESAQGRREVILVDPSVAHAESLIDALKAQRAAIAAQSQSSGGPSGAASAAAAGEWFIHILDAGKDGIGQVTEILKSYERLDAVHILSHGGQGEMSLGTSAVLQGVLEARSAEISAWGQSLKEGADILLYGCDVAAGEAGVRFVQTLGSLTGADVAASTDKTGSDAAGGNWNLEHRTGAIEAAPLFAAGGDGYGHLLQDIVGTAASETLTGTGDGDSYIFSNGDRKSVV